LVAKLPATLKVFLATFGVPFSASSGKYIDMLSAVCHLVLKSHWKGLEKGELP